MLGWGLDTGERGHKLQGGGLEFRIAGWRFRGGEAMSRLRHDVVHAWRFLRARPSPAAFTALVLALGIGLLSAMFALADPFLLRPLPYPRATELAVIRIFRQARRTVARAGVVQPSVRDLEAHDELFVALGAYRDSGAIRVRVGGRSAILRTAEVSERFFGILGAPVPRFDDADGSGGLNVALVVTAAAAGRLTDSPADLVGRTLTRQGGGTVVVGAVLPPGFLFPSPDVLFPFDAFKVVSARGMLLDHVDQDVGSSSLQPPTIIARLRAGVTPAQVGVALASTLAETPGRRLEVRSLVSRMKSRVRPLALGALSAGILIMLVCVANMANLLLARNLSRTRELATLEALGAQPRDVMRLLLVELGLMVLAGVTVGLVLARAALAATTVLAPVEYVALGQPSMTARVVAFGCALGTLMMAVGLLPALAAWRAAKSRELAQQASAETWHARGLRFVMTSGQTMFAVVLLSGAVLFIRSYVNVIGQESGFAGKALVVTASYPPDDIGARLQHEVEETLRRLRHLAGVEAAGAMRGAMVDRFLVLGGLFVGGQTFSAESKRVTPGYFEASGTTVLSGRGLKAEDGRNAVVINESLARQISSDGKVVGRLAGSGTEIVGVVRDSFSLALDFTPQPSVYSLFENPEGCVGSGCDNRISYVVRRGRGVDNKAVAVRVVTGVNPDAVVLEASSIQERLAGSIKDRSFATLVVGLFALGAVSVCVAGLAGLVAFVVARRTREIAVRIAVGATPNRIVALVLKEGATATVVGMLGGVLVGRWGCTLVEHFAYQVETSDWSTTLIALSAMVLVAAMSVALPLRRALRLSPAAALRVE